MDKTDQPVEDQGDSRLSTERDSPAQMEAFNITDNNEKSSQHHELSEKSKHSTRAHFYKATICVTLCLTVVAFITFLMVEGHIKLWEQAKKQQLFKESFDQYMILFNKTYANATEKAYRLETYSKNRQVLWEQNLKMICGDGSCDMQDIYKVGRRRNL